MIYKLNVALTAHGTARFVGSVATSVSAGTQHGRRSAPAIPAPERTFRRTVPVSAANPRQRRRWPRGGRPVADCHRRTTATAKAFQLVRLVRARDNGVTQLVLGQTMAVSALESVRRTSCIM